MNNQRPLYRPRWRRPTLNKNLCVSYNDLPLTQITSCSFDNWTTQSHGFIVHCSETKRWFVVKRKHTHAYLLLLWVRYDKAMIPAIVKEMTIIELKSFAIALKSYGAYCDALSESQCTTINKEDSHYELKYKKLLQHADFITSNINKYGSTSRKEMWFWPKGKKEDKFESEIDTAKRELLEEASITSIGPHYNILPTKITHEWKSISRQKQINVFWIMVIPKEFKCGPIKATNNELGDRGWYPKSRIADMLPSSFKEIFYNEVCSQIDKFYTINTQIQKDISRIMKINSLLNNKKLWDNSMINSLIVSIEKSKEELENNTRSLTRSA